jgi:threonine/homoserine/homoserine lactone efflux protein
MIQALIVGLASGFVGSIPVAGPIAFLVLARGLAGRFRSGLYVGLGNAVAEAGYAFAACWGTSCFLARHPSLAPFCQGVAALLLIAIGLYFALRRPKKDTTTVAREEDGRRGGFALGFTITIFNPMLIATWTLWMTTVHGLGLLPTGPFVAFPFAVGVCIGIGSWYRVMLEILCRHRERLSANALKLALQGVGVGLVGMGTWLGTGFAKYVVAHWPLV